MHAEAMAWIDGVARSWQQPVQQIPAPRLPPLIGRTGGATHPATAEITTVPPQQALPRPREAA
jgi:hypothetical protein